MKVGLFIDTYYPMVDGVIKVVDNYAQRLAKKCDVTVFCPNFIGYDSDKDKQYPYRIVRCHSLPLIRLDYSLPAPILDATFEKELLNSRLDIVHIHSPFTVGMTGMAYAKLHKKPLIATLHSQYKQDIEKSLHLTVPVDVAMTGIMNIFNVCDQCWAVNNEIKNLYENSYGLKSTCKVRLNATDHIPVKNPVEAHSMVNATYHLSENDLVFLFTGRINFIKNIDFIIRSLALVKKHGLTFKMLFVGKGQDEKKLANLVAENDLQEEVVMCGLINDKSILEAIYSRAKLFLFPSLYDANSLVQIEAACQGTPGVFLQGARTAATITDNVNGFISAPSEEAYASKIIEILSNHELYEKVAQGARRDLFLNWDDVVEGVYKDYSDLMQQSRK